GAAGLGDQYERLTVRRPRAAAELLVGQREPADRVGARRPLGDGELHWLVVVGPLPGLVQDQQIIEMPQRQTNLGALSQPQLDARSIDLRVRELLVERSPQRLSIANIESG